MPVEKKEKETAVSDAKSQQIQNYQILEQLEESNFAQIYKVSDSKNRNLILKIAREKNPHHNELISREFQILSQFQHPNIMQVYDYNIHEDGRAYFTSEYIQGKPINNFFKGLTEEFIAAKIQVINALAAFHNKGFIHSDLKPEHILYNPEDKRAVLIDFGFAQSVMDMKLGGTIGYMAPEVFKGINIDQRSDLYSFGVIMYEILAGKRPGDTYEPIAVLTEETNKIFRRLLSHEPAIRPTIPELYQTFSRYVPKIKIAIPEYEVRLPETGYVEIPEIVNKLTSEKGKALIIRGDTGSGKTRLLKELKYRYLMQGHDVLYYVSSEKTFFHEALQTFIGAKAIDHTAHEDKFAIFEEITQGLLEYARDKKVVVMADDLDDLSDYSLKFFRYIGYGLRDTNILLIGTARTDGETGIEETTGEETRGGEKERIEGLGFETLNLRPFTEEETRKLIAKTFFELKYIPADKIDFGRWLHKQSGGNPLFINEILKSLYNERVLFYQTNQWQLKSDLLEKVKIPSRIDELLEKRIENLGPEELRILKILSSADYPLEPAIMNVVLKSDISIMLEHLKQLGLTRDERAGDKLVIAVPNHILVEVIRKSLADDERKTYAESLISAIETISPDAKDYVPMLAQLSDEVGDREKAYHYYEIAAKDAETIYDYDAAIKYYEKLAGYSQSVSPSKYSEFLVKLGDLNQGAGRNRSALDYYNTALGLGKKEVLPKIYSGIGEVHLTIGEYSEAAKHFESAIDLIEPTTSFYIRTANSLSYAYANLSKFEETERILEKSSSLSEMLNDTKMRADTFYYQAMFEWYRHNAERGIEITRNLLDFCVQDASLLSYSALGSSLISSFYLQRNELAMVREYLEQAIEGFAKIKHINALCTAVCNKAALTLKGGGYASAKALYEEVLMRILQINNQPQQCVALANLASINEDLGRFGEAIGLNNKALEVDPDYVWAVYYHVRVLCKRGDINRANEILAGRVKIKEEVFYSVALALINSALSEIKQGDDVLNHALEIIEKQSPNLETKSESFMVAIQFYYEKSDFEKSSGFAKKVIELTNPLGREYNIASAFIKINNFNLKNTNSLNIEKEADRLKEIGCIYDYAYLKKLRAESIMNRSIMPGQISEIVEELNSAREIFESIGAGLELGRTRKLQERLFPIISKELSQRTISTQYLNTFSKLAELISDNLGDENFIQNILDLVIKSTNAERGALFINTPEGMALIAGRDIDQDTINDASELSQTAIKELEKNRIVFAQDALTDPKFNIHKSVMLNQIHSLLCIPLSIGSNVVGAIYCDSRSASNIFGSQDKDFLLTVSKILASVIEKSINFRSLHEGMAVLRSNIIEEIGSSGYLMGKSNVMKGIYRMIDSVAETNSPVLILGETGTGKGMIARLIHLKSKRQNKKFTSINCGTIPETLLESELFGHKRGAFTGAVSDKKGLLEEGQGGTIFLDEISNTSMAFQGKLLEAIEEKIIRRVGETTTRNIDVRFLFATNKDLEIEVEEGRFRKDLLYRINVFAIEVPPLRERSSDIPHLTQFFLERYVKESGKRLEGFNTEAMQALREYIWTGNVRELQNVIERAAVLAKSHLITLEDIGFEKVKKEDIMPLKEIRKEAIVEALNATGWNVTKTAKLLGIGRRSLYRYIKDFNITKNSTRTV